MKHPKCVIKDKTTTLYFLPLIVSFICCFHPLKPHNSGRQYFFYYLNDYFSM